MCIITVAEAHLSSEIAAQKSLKWLLRLDHLPLKKEAGFSLPVESTLRLNL